MRKTANPNVDENRALQRYVREEKELKEALCAGRERIVDVLRAKGKLTLVLSSGVRLIFLQELLTGLDGSPELEPCLLVTNTKGQFSRKYILSDLYD